MATLYDVKLTAADYQKYNNRDYSFIFSQKNLLPSLKKGDIVRIKNDTNYDYRNGGKLVWDGEKLINLEYSVDDYGAAPKSLPVGVSGFCATHWEEVIDHNCYVYATFNSDIHDIIYNFSIGQKDSIDNKKIEKYQVQFDLITKTERYSWVYTCIIFYKTLSFMFNGTRWGIIISINDDEDDASYIIGDWAIPYEDSSDIAIFSYISDENEQYVVNSVDRKNTLYVGQLY